MTMEDMQNSLEEHEQCVTERRNVERTDNQALQAKTSQQRYMRLGGR